MRTLVKKILDLEQKYNLFNKKFKNFSVWPYYRMYFYYSISEDIGILDKPVSGFKKDFKYIKRVFDIFFKIRKLLEKKEVFVLEHPRSNKDGIDIYTYDIVNFLGKEKCSFFSFSNNGIINKNDNVVILDIVKIISKVYSSLFYRFVKIDNNIISFFEEFPSLNLNKYIKQYKRYYLELKIQYYFYYFLLKAKKTKKVILTVSYFNMPLIFAAKKLGIEVIEVQHGVISKYHLGYHYPYYETQFFPDKLFTFGKFWNNSAKFPKNCKVVAVGNNFLYTKKDKIKKIKNTILVISQATIGKELSRFIENNIKDLYNYTIYFKLHPNEFNKYEEKYLDILKYENIQIIKDEISINELQNFCEYQIGVYSTAIYEGIEKKCKTILLNTIGIEYMEQILKENLAVLVNYEEKLITKLTKVHKPLNIIFFEKFNYEVINESL